MCSEIIITKSKCLIDSKAASFANLAGTKDYEKCTLILTEGDSAKAPATIGVL